MGFPRQEYWNGLLFPPPGDIPDPGIEPTSLPSSSLQANSLLAEPPGLHREPFSFKSLLDWKMENEQNLMLQQVLDRIQ